MAWYDGGLRFSCQRCGNCCSGRGSHVRVSAREIEALAAATDLTPAEFEERHTQVVFGECVLRDVDTGVEHEGDCEWLDRNADGTTACRVQDAKPDQCRSYPFWPRTLRSARTWEAEGLSCAGIGKGGTVPAPEIERHMGLEDRLAALDGLMAELDAETAELGAACWLSGNCCDFPTAGHRLYASRLEAERFARAVDLASWDPHTGLCPAWKDRRCTAREHRPAACRSYHCDPAAEDATGDLTERYVEALKGLHRLHGADWDYRDWIEHLARLREERLAASGAPAKGRSGPPL